MSKNKIKVLIELDEELFKNVVEQTKDGYIGSDVWIAVANGTLYNPSGDAISRSALKTELEAYRRTRNYRSDEEEAQNSLLNNILEDIDYAQAIELDSRPKGEWVDEGQYAEGHSEHAYICKECGYQIIEKPNMIFENRFCKYCGAKMKGGAE